MAKQKESLKDNLNKLAAKLYADQGYRVRDGYDFSQSSHPGERAVFVAAKIAYAHFRERMPRASSFWEDELK